MEERQRKPIADALICFNMLPNFIVEAYGPDFVKLVAEPVNREGEY